MAQNLPHLGTRDLPAIELLPRVSRREHEAAVPPGRAWPRTYRTTALEICQQAGQSLPDERAISAFLKDLRSQVQLPSGVSSRKQQSLPRHVTMALPSKVLWKAGSTKTQNDGRLIQGARTRHRSKRCPANAGPVRTDPSGGPPQEAGEPHPTTKRCPQHPRCGPAPQEKPGSLPQRPRNKTSLPSDVTSKQLLNRLR